MISASSVGKASLVGGGVLAGDMTVGAGAENLDHVPYIDETVVFADPPGPALDRGAVHLDCPPAVPADQVVVMAAAAAAIHRLAVRRPEHVDLAVVGQLLQGAVHRGKTDPVAGSTQPGVQF